MERDVAPRGAGQERAAVGRGLNTILTLPHDATAIRQFLTMLLERIDDAPEPRIQGLVLAPDVETVIAIGRVAATMDRPSHATLVAVPSPRRALRALRATVPTMLIVTPDDLLALLQESAAKLDAVRAVAFAFAEDLVAVGDAALATVIAEVPKDAARILIASRLTPDVEAFAERYVRRIARAAPAPIEPLRGPVSYLTVGAATRASALRRVLDTIDPESAIVYARTADGARDARAELAGMGAAAAGVSVTTEAMPIDGPLLVLYELPASAAELRLLAGTEVLRQVVALVRARELSLLRSLTGAAPRPLVLAGPAERARAREAALREELRAVLAGGVPSRELLMLEPLLEEFEGAEIAAAALRLLERARELRPSGSAPLAAAMVEEPATAAAPSGRMARVFVNAGSRDGAAARDFVGAIANVAGIPADRIGKVDVRESHTLVELSAADAESVVERLAGATIRGRRVAPRLDRERAPGDRGSGRRESGERHAVRGRGVSTARDRAPGRPSDRARGNRPDRKPSPGGRRAG